MAWSIAQLAIFLLLVIFMWEVILRLWEKLCYSFSVEWVINIIAVILKLKKTAYLYVKERLYDPINLKEEEEKEIVLIQQ